MAAHYVINERQMEFNRNQAAPKDRSIFRKNIGLALLHRDGDPYETIWKIKFTTPASREELGSRLDIEKERQIEDYVTRILRERFTFRCIELEGQDRRMGSQGLEAPLIGTLAKCSKCQPSSNWLGRCSPKPKIVQSGLWLEKYLQASELTQDSMAELEALL
jgi:hypothetical protein